MRPRRLEPDSENAPQPGPARGRWHRLVQQLVERPGGDCQAPVQRHVGLAGGLSHHQKGEGDGSIGSEENG
jgi:hypothetical protein